MIGHPSFLAKDKREYNREWLCVLQGQRDSLQGSNPWQPSSAEKMHLEAGSETTEGHQDKNVSRRRVYQGLVQERVHAY